MGPLLRLNTLGNPLVLLNDGGLYMVGLISRSTISEITSITSVSTGGLEIFFLLLLLSLLLLLLLLLLLFRYVLTYWNDLHWVPTKKHDT